MGGGGPRARRRVVFHLDLDAFYAQVERRRLGLDPSVPLAVQQWNGLIAINYAARALGVSRHSRANEAKQSFPQLRCVHVEVLRQGEDGAPVVAEDPAGQGDPVQTSNEGNADSGAPGAPGSRRATRDETKASLRRYREASFEVMNVIRGFVPSRVIERASIDEVYIDATEIVNEPSAEHADEAAEFADLRRKLTENGTNILGEEFSERDIHLARGVLLLSKIRTAVCDKTSFTMSGGVAENKLLAKIASAKHKPNQQTVVPHRYAAALVRSLPFKKVPGYGGKYGGMLAELLQQHSPQVATDTATLENVIRSVPFDRLTERFGPDGAQSILRRANGECDKPVVPKMAPKSLLSAKTFQATRGEKPVLGWLKLLATELFGRAHTDAVMFGRIPTKMTLRWSGREKGHHITKRVAVPNPNPFLAYATLRQDAGAQAALEYLDAAVPRVVDACAGEVPFNELTWGLSLQLDSFESSSIPGSWGDNDTMTAQQSQFKQFFAKRPSRPASAPVPSGSQSCQTRGDQASPACADGAGAVASNSAPSAAESAVVADTRNGVAAAARTIQTFFAQKPLPGQAGKPELGAPSDQKLGHSSSPGVTLSHDDTAAAAKHALPNAEVGAPVLQAECNDAPGTSGVSGNRQFYDGKDDADDSDDCDNAVLALAAERAERQAERQAAAQGVTAPKTASSSATICSAAALQQQVVVDIESDEGEAAARAAAEKAAADFIASERAAAERLEQERLSAERAAAEKRAQALQTKAASNAFNRMLLSSMENGFSNKRRPGAGSSKTKRRKR